MAEDVKTRIKRLAAEGDYSSAIDELREARADAYLERDTDELARLLEVAEHLVAKAPTNLDRMRARDAVGIIRGNISSLNRVTAPRSVSPPRKPTTAPPTAREAAPGCVVLLLIVGVAIFGVSRLIGGDDGRGGGAKATTSAASADIVVNPDASFCEEYSPIEKIKVVVSATNLGDDDGTLSVTPVRNYTDGTSNRSFLDTIYVEVPAGQTRVGFATFGYKSFEHGLASCELEFERDGQTESVSVRVNNY